MTNSKTGHAISSRRLPRKPCRLPLNSSGRAKGREESSPEINPSTSEDWALYLRDDEHRCCQSQTQTCGARAAPSPMICARHTKSFTSTACRVCEPNILYGGGWEGDLTLTFSRNKTNNSVPPPRSGGGGPCAA